MTPHQWGLSNFKKILLIMVPQKSKKKEKFKNRKKSPWFFLQKKTPKNESFSIVIQSKQIVLNRTKSY